MLPEPFPGEFQLIRELGSGAFGTVWLARDLQLMRLVALKTLRVGATDTASELALAAMLNEAQLLATVRHPNLLAVYAWRQSGSDHYLVLQFVKGGAMVDRVTPQSSLAWEIAGRYAADIGEALLHVHQKGIIHRDVKPANVLWDPESDEAILADFGLSTRLANAGSVAGTPHYMAPEAFDGIVTPALDVYGLAATFFYLLTGQAPFRGTRISEIRAAVIRGLPQPDERFRQTPETLEQLVRDGLRVAPEQRPSLADFAARLRGALNHSLADALSSIQLKSSTLPPTDASQLVHMRVSREKGDGSFEVLASTPPSPKRFLRDLKRVPNVPQQVRLQTGDKVRLEVMTEQAGYVTVINVGPTGNLNLLHPDDSGLSRTRLVAGEWLHMLDVELSPPVGHERILAIWSDNPEPLMSESADTSSSEDGAYRATRLLTQLARALETARSQHRLTLLDFNHESAPPA